MLYIITYLWAFYIKKDTVKRKVELLAPGGDVNSIKAAILGGADAIYCGLEKFNARNRATNISINDLNGILRLAHKNDCQIFITLNIIIVDNEIPALFTLLNKLVNTSIDGIIIQDLGMFYIISNYFKQLDIHASTQLTTHNEGQIRFLAQLNASRVNLSRELNIQEINKLTSIATNHNVLTEVFVHGSNCISYSGICYISSVLSGNSGNRGRCSQPCRDKYETTNIGNQYPLNLKDNSAYLNLQELYDAGVASLKIEGRIKNVDYVHTVVDSWRKQIDRLYNQESLSSDKKMLYKVFNRDFSNSYLRGEINKDMFIDNPRDHSIAHLSEIKDYLSEQEREQDKIKLYKEKDSILAKVQSGISTLDAAKAPLKLIFSGRKGEKLIIQVQSEDTKFEIISEQTLQIKVVDSLNEEIILKKFKSLNDTEYYIGEIDTEQLEEYAFISFKELTQLRRQIQFILNDSKEYIDPIKTPLIKRINQEAIEASLSVLISSKEDIIICRESSSKIYFQMPNSLKGIYSDTVKLFTENTDLTPVFPSIILQDDYAEMRRFLDEVKPKEIVTNNTGIAYEAYEKDISWTAGPQLNLVNSYSLKTLKEQFNCSGAFISNEISKNQIKGIKKPEDFQLHYSIYHPIVLMTSRQCFNRQVEDCEKYEMDNSCITDCQKCSSITSIKQITSIVEKSKGNLNSLYSDINYLNTQIITDIPKLFDSYMVDLRKIKTSTKVEVDKESVIKLFQETISGMADSKQKLEQVIHPTSNTQYKKGI